MKKILITLLFLFTSITLFSKTKHAKVANAKNRSCNPHKSTQSISICGVTFPAHISGDIDNAYKVYSDYITLKQAREMIGNYANNTMSQIDPNLGYFIFDAGKFFNFIYTVCQQNTAQGSIPGTPCSLQDIQFVFGIDTNINNEITMAIVGVASDHKTFLGYMDTKNVKNVLSIPSVGDITDSLEYLPENTNTNYPIPSGQQVQKICDTVIFANPTQPTDYIPIATANYFQEKFRSKIAEPTTSFTFDAGTLADYISSINGIQNVAVILARDGVLRLLIAGIDANGKPVYYKIGSTSYVLEHCFPCPADCPGVSGAIHLDLK